MAKQKAPLPPGSNFVRGIIERELAANKFAEKNGQVALEMQHIKKQDKSMSRKSARAFRLSQMAIYTLVMPKVSSSTLA